jgi:uncharacterized Zn ribbon protein
MCAEAREHNGNYRDATETTACDRCGEEFEYHPWATEGVYCPNCVAEVEEFLGTQYKDGHDIEHQVRV